MKPYRPAAIGIPKSSRETRSPRENFWAVWKGPCRPSPPPLTAWCCTKQAITAPFDGVVLYQTHILGVSQGMPLLAYGKLREEGGLSRRETEGML